MRHARGELAHAGQFFGMHQRLARVFELFLGAGQFGDGLVQFLDGVRQAHLAFGEALVNGDGVFQAGVVAAGAAVEFVFRLGLAEVAQDARQVFLGGRRDALVVGAVRAGSSPGRRSASIVCLPDRLRRSRPAAGARTGATWARRLNMGACWLIPAPMMQPLQQSTSRNLASSCPDSNSSMAFTKSVRPCAAMIAPASGSSLRPAACSMPRLMEKSAPRPGCGGSNSLGAAVSATMPRPREHAAQFGESDHRVHAALQRGAGGLGLLGDAGADEHDLQVAGPCLSVQRRGPWPPWATRSAPGRPPNADNSVRCNRRRRDKWWRCSACRPPRASSLA